MVERPSRRSWSGREALTKVQETLPNIWEWSGGPPGGPGVVGKPTERSGSGWEALPEVQE